MTDGTTTTWRDLHNVMADVAARWSVRAKEAEAEVERLRAAIQEQLQEREWHHSLCGGEAGCVCNQGWRLTLALKGADSGDQETL